MAKDMNVKKYIGWRRVSTFKQNRSGLGLEAQKEIIRYFVERDNGELVADYSECYTGTELLPYCNRADTPRPPAHISRSYTLRKR